MDLAKIKARQALSSGGGFKFKDGATNIRIFQFHHVVTAEDVKRGLFTKEKLGKKEMEIDRPVVVHFGVGGDSKRPVLTNPTLQAKYEQIKEAKGYESQEARKLSPTPRFAVNLADTDVKPRKVHQTLLPKTVYNAILNKLSNPDYAVDGVYGAKLLGLAGRDFIVTYKKDAPGTAKYTVDIRDKELCAKMNEEVLKQVKDLFSDAGWKALGIIEQGAEAETEEEVTTEEDAPVADGEETPTDESDAKPAEEEEATEETEAKEEPVPEPEEEPAEEPVRKPAKAPAKAPAKPATKGKPVTAGKKPRREED